MRQAGARGGGKNGNFTSEASAQLEAVAVPILSQFHAWIPPSATSVVAEGPTGQGSVLENGMALGRGRGTAGCGGDEEKVMTSGPPQAGASWAGKAQFMVLLPAGVLSSVYSYGMNSSWRNYFYKFVKQLKDSHFRRRRRLYL